MNVSILDNLDLNRLARITSITDIQAGIDLNPDVTYQNAVGSSHFNFLYARENGVTIDASGGNVSFVSGSSIELKPGFIAQSGSRFVARIGDVDGGCLWPSDSFTGFNYAPVAGVYPGGNNNGNNNSSNGNKTNAANIAAQPYLKCYPNPSSNTFTIDIRGFDSANNTTLSVYNTMGTKVEAIILPSSTQTYNFNANDYNLSNGMYYIVVENGITSLSAKVLFDKQ